MMNVASVSNNTVTVSGQSVATIEPSTVVNDTFSTSGIARAPYLTQAREYEIDGICAEDTERGVPESCVDVEGTQLYAPAHGAEHVAEDADYKRQTNPPEVAVAAYDFHHLKEVDVVKQQPAQS